VSALASLGTASRRAFLLGTSTALFLARAGLAQEVGRVYRLGFLVQAPKKNFGFLFDELRLHGFFEPDNLSVQPNGFSAPVERLDQIAAEVVKARPEVIYVGGAAAARAAKQATSTIPIVANSDDMIREGLVESLAHPGGNITGISILATELDGKRLELLSEIVPGVRRIAALTDPGTTPPDQLDLLLALARSHGIDLSIHTASAAGEIDEAIGAAQAAGVQAIDVMASALFNANRARVLARIAEAKLPAMYQWPEYGQEGALICYGPSIEGFYRQAGRLIAKIFRGAKPADLPVEQPSRIDLVINLITAKTLGVTVPQSLLLRAEHVIE
jgi:ABC-type uncharacterized transport system substrate-binding protein